MPDEGYPQPACFGFLMILRSLAVDNPSTGTSEVQEHAGAARLSSEKGGKIMIGKSSSFLTKEL
jgi:hypothetical protein